MNRYSRLQRTTPLKRGGFLKRKTRLNPISKDRRFERGEYRTTREEHLAAHPLCQIYLARHRIEEDPAVAEFRERGANRFGYFQYRGFMIPLATQIHHRNKARRERLIDVRWVMSAAHCEHQYVEDNKSEAREIGLLLPFQADRDGRWGSGNQALTTRDLILARATGRA